MFKGWSLFFFLSLLCWKIYGDGQRHAAHTYGYELEYSSQHDETFLGRHPALDKRKPTEGKLQDEGSIDVSDKAQKKFNLNPKGIVEWGGTTLEVTSRVYRKDDSRQNLEDTFGDIEKVTTEFKKWNRKHPRKKSTPFWIHVHTRFDKDQFTNAGVSEDEVKAWMSRVDDWVFHWRAKKNKEVWSIYRNYPYPRVSPDRISVRGGIRMISDDSPIDIPEQKYRGQGKQWDVEIRGFPLHVDMDGKKVSDMKDVAEYIQEVATENPNLAKTDPDRQSLLYQYANKLEEEVARRRKLRGLKDLTPDQVKWLQDLAHLGTYGWAYTRDNVQTSNGMQNIIPLMGYEYAPYLPRSKRLELARAKDDFLDNMIDLVDSRYDKRHSKKNVLQNNGLDYLAPRKGSNAQTEKFYGALYDFGRYMNRFTRRTKLYDALRDSLKRPVPTELASVNDEIGYIPYVLKRWKLGKSEEEIKDIDIRRNNHFRRIHAENTLKKIPFDSVVRAYKYGDISKQDFLDITYIINDRADLVGTDDCCDSEARELAAIAEQQRNIARLDMPQSSEKLLRLIREYVQKNGENTVQPMVVVEQMAKKFEAIGVNDLFQLRKALKYGLNKKIKEHNKKHGTKLKSFTNEGVDFINEILSERGF